MSQVAQIKSGKLVATFNTTYGALTLLGLNTFALLAIDRSLGIPSWIKSAAAIFLAL